MKAHNNIKTLCQCFEILLVCSCLITNRTSLKLKSLSNLKFVVRGL